MTTCSTVTAELRGTSHPADLAERAHMPLVLDPEMQRLFDVLSQVAPTNLPVLLLGETGSGKEGAAEWVHRQSGRARDRFVKVNCASLSESVIESELFGHERGAFTGALARREGVFEAADGGTLLLDEIGELSLRAQAKLLRVLETGEIVRVGSTQSLRVDVRIVAATHRDLGELVERGEFREDLFYRLSGLTLTIAPLRARPSEIVPLAMLFLRRAARSMNRPLSLSEAAAVALQRHSWPGNVRELRNVVARGAALCRGGLLTPEHLALGEPRRSAPASTMPPSSPALETAVVEASAGAGAGAGAGEAGAAAAAAGRSSVRCELRAYERARILAALAATSGNQTAAAKLLGLSRRTLTNKLNAHGIDRPRKRSRTTPPSGQGQG